MIHKSLLIFGIIFMLLLTTSCDLSKPEDVNKALIENILIQMQTDFRQLNLAGVMSAYSPDYLHEGRSINEEQVIWQNRMNTYYSFDFTNLDYDINEDTAVVSGTAKWYTTMQVVISAEPADHGDFSYFIKVDGKWHIYGNRENYRK